MPVRDRKMPDTQPAESVQAPALPSFAAPTSEFDVASYTKPFLDFISNNPTVFHAVSHFGSQLSSAGFTHLSEKDQWTSKLQAGGKYFFTRNGSGLIAFTIGSDYEAGNGIKMVASHVDALTAKVKPVSTKPTSVGYQQLGVAQYAGALNQTWLDRDLGIGGRVFVKSSSSGKIETKLVKLDWPIARIPTIAPHFGIAAEGQPNRETRMVPVIGIDNSDLSSSTTTTDSPDSTPTNAFTSTQHPLLVRTITSALSLTSSSQIIGWELELFDTQPAQLGGLDKSLLFAGRIDDKLCSYAAIEALLSSSSSSSSPKTINLVGLFDDEEVGSLLRQGAHSNFLPSTIERIVSAFLTSSGTPLAGPLYQTYANSFLVSADVCHAYNPNYSDVYLKDHTPRLNVGIAVSFDSNAHMTTDGASYALFSRIAEKSGNTLQLFQIRNDSRSGGTVGPMLSSAMGVRSIDAGIPQLSMHSIRATTGRLDPGLGVKCFKGFFEEFEMVEAEFV